MLKAEENWCTVCNKEDSGGTRQGNKTFWQFRVEGGRREWRLASLVGIPNTPATCHMK